MLQGCTTRVCCYRFFVRLQFEVNDEGMMIGYVKRVSYKAGFRECVERVCKEVC